MAPRHAGKATIVLSMFVAVLVIHQTIRSISNLGEEVSLNANHIKHHKHRNRTHSQAQRLGRIDEVDFKDGDQTIVKNMINGVQDSACKAQHIENFFTSMNHSFVSLVKDLDHPVLTKPYLHCSADLAMIFDKLSATAFAPVKSNFVTNIERITALYDSDQEKYSTLQAIVEEDVKYGRHKDDDSTSNSILWLTRSLLFVTEMFDNIEDQETFSGAIAIAYDKVLKQYHNWFVKKIFRIMIPALPSKDSAQIAFSIDPADVEKSDYMECLYETLDIYNEALLKVCHKIEDYFKTQDLIILDRSQWEV